MAALTLGKQRRCEGGYVLLLTLITLVVLLFGVLFTMRGSLLQSVMTGNTAQRQKDVQASDMALRQVQQAIIQTASDVPLEVAASGASWFYVPPNTGSPWAVPGSSPAPSYWQNCQAAKTCDTLSNVEAVFNANSPQMAPKLPPLSGYTALVTVVPTNLPADTYACGTTGFTATYYDIFLHTQEANDTTAVNTESVFKLCTPGSS